MDRSYVHPGGVAQSRPAGTLVLRAFLPYAIDPARPDATRLLGPRPPARCRIGLHTWLAPELSLRSARTGFAVAFCLRCTEQRPLEKQTTRTLRPSVAAAW